MIDLWLTRRFKVKGDSRFVALYRSRMAVEWSFKAGKLDLTMENLRWRGVAKIRMHVVIIFFHASMLWQLHLIKIGRPDLASSIAAFTY